MNRNGKLSRRTMLRLASASAAGLTGWTTAQAVRKPDLRIVDCHAHIYGEDEIKYPTIENPYRPPEGKGTVSHLKQEMKQAGVSHVTAIQTSTFYRFDNRFTADSARHNPEFMVGVITLDPDNPASPAMLKDYVENYNVRGMRSIPAANGKLDDPGVDRLWATAESLGIVINALVGSEKRAELQALAARHPKLRVVVDHCLNLKAGSNMKDTLNEMLSLSSLPNIHAKLTFIPTGSAEPYPCQDMHAPCRAIIDRFGADRCVWGSDFPCELWCPKVSYSQHLRIFTHELGLALEDKRAVLGETASRLWLQQR